MINRLKRNVIRRLSDEVSAHNPIKFLNKLNIDEYFPVVIATLYLYTRMKRGTNKSVYLTEVASAIGHSIRNKYKLKRDSALAIKAGAFLLYTFEQAGMVQIVLGKGSNGHGSYILKINDDPAICLLWNSLPVRLIEKLPSEKPYAPWVSTRHKETGLSLVKTGNKDVLDKITPATHPILFNVINRKLEVGWTVNAELYHVHVWALKEKTEAFAEIWEQQNPEAKVTKLREAKAIGDIAKRFIDKTFFHLYYFDFRGRIYPATAYLHEQGSDLARGLLLRSDSKAIGREGFFWLCVSIASNWGGSCGRRDGAKTDKIPLKDRFQWVLDNEDIFLDYASNPKEYQNWMQADKPWQFLAACIELRKLREWQTNFTFDGSGPDYSNYNYESHLEVYIDGSNNGSQHLSALTRDEVTAPHVNLVPSDLPGDLYKYIADHVWARLEKAYNDMAPFERELCETFIDNIIDLKRQIYEAEPQSEERKCLIDKIQKEKNLNIFLQDKACVVYWLRVTDPKERRKICKRNVMTLPLTRRK